MKVRFDQKRDPAVSRGMRVSYGAARRQVPRLRWFIIALLVTSPILYFGWTILRGGLVVDAPGVLHYETVKFGAVVSGVVRDVHVEENDPVTSGMLLVELGNAELSARVEHLSEELERLAAEQEIYRGRAERRLRAAEREIDSLEQLLASQQQWLSEVQRLSQIGAATSRERLQVEAQRQETNARLLDANNRLQDAERTVDEGDAALRQREQQMRLERDLSRNTMRFLAVRADIDGDVVDLEVEPGDTVGPGTTLLTVARESEPRVTAYLRPRDGRFARKGAPVRVELPDGATLRGEITERPRLTGQVPAGIQRALGDGNANLMVRVQLDDTVPEAMAVHRLPLTVEFASGPGVLWGRLQATFSSEGRVAPEADVVPE